MYIICHNLVVVQKNYNSDMNKAADMIQANRIGANVIFVLTI